MCGTSSASVETPDAPLVAKSPEIPEEHALQGFDGVRAYAIDPERSTALLEDTLGFQRQGDDYAWEARGDQRGGWYAYDAAPEGRGIPGAGTVHHVAWATTMEEHEAWQQRVAEAGQRPTPVIDRFYFKSSTSASRTGSSSSSPPSAPVSQPTRTPSISASASPSLPTSSTCASRSSPG